ncbi:MAG: hypothetical protein J6N76_10830 [Lachnospiraceae bacterium]|nr:hypothetical protein [Lachnospiraceae bacterium]
MSEDIMSTAQKAELYGVQSFEEEHKLSETTDSAQLAFGEEEKPMDPISELRERVKTDFTSFWESDMDSSLHSLALRHDLKGENWRKQGEEKEKEARKTLDQSVKEMTLFDSGRTEKSRRNHLSEASQGFEKAALTFTRIQAEKRELSKLKSSKGEEAELSARVMENIRRAEQTINLMYSSKIEALKGTGKRGDEEKRQIAEIKDEQARMLLNLYQSEAKSPLLTAEARESLMQTALKLKVYRDSTSTRLSFAGEGTLADYSEYQELKEEEVFKLAGENRYNKEPGLIRKLWGKFGKKRFDDEGRSFGYVFTYNSFLINQYIRARDGSPSDQWKFERRLRLHAGFTKKISGKELDEYVELWKKKAEETIRDLDTATGTTVEKGQEPCHQELSHKTKVYRMVDGGMLQWGLGINDPMCDLSTVKDPKELRKRDTAQIVEAINKRAGTVVEDKGFMSVGWCVDKAFVNRPIMLTLLVEEGTRCYVTKNFKEAELIFGRGTKYQLVCAINHTVDAEKLRQSVQVEDDTEKAEDLVSGKTVDFKGIELVMKVIPDKNETQRKQDSEGR